MRTRILRFGTIVMIGTLLIGSAFQITSAVFCGLFALGFILISIAILPGIQDPPAPTYSSSLPGGIDQENEIAELYAATHNPDFGRWGDRQIGHKWTGKAPNGSHAEFITWIVDGKQFRQRVK